MKEYNAQKLPGSAGEHALQNQLHTQKQALAFYNKQVLDELAPMMQAFIKEQEMVFLSTADKHGECDASFRAGEAGFMQVVNKKRIIYPEYKGNGIMASMGNITENGHIGLLFIDFFEKTIGLHVNGKAKIIQKEDLAFYTQENIEVKRSLQAQEQIKKIVSYIVIEIEETYIHCSQYIPLLEKKDKKIHWSLNSAQYKGGDAFAVKGYPRPWI